MALSEKVCGINENLLFGFSWEVWEPAMLPLRFFPKLREKECLDVLESIEGRG